MKMRKNYFPILGTLLVIVGIFSASPSKATNLFTSSVKSSTFSPADIEFAQGMIPHHQQAIVMAKIALKKSHDARIISLAKAIRDAQGPEVLIMKKWLSEAKVSSMGMSMMMDGMLSTRELNALKSASGANFDKLFLRGMIQHHQGAIRMAEKVSASSNPEVKRLSQNIIAAQRNEIIKMRVLLSK